MVGFSLNVDDDVNVNDDTKSKADFYISTRLLFPSGRFKDDEEELLVCICFNNDCRTENSDEFNFEIVYRNERIIANKQRWSAAEMALFDRLTKVGSVEISPKELADIIDHEVIENNYQNWCRYY